MKSAMASVEKVILGDHAACCVAEAIQPGDVLEQRAKFNELVDLFSEVNR